MQNRTPTLALLLAALTTPAIALAGHPDDGSGLLGKRYVEAGAFILDYQNFEDDGYGVGTTVNIPVAARFDLGATFEHTWEEGAQSENFQDLSAYATFHTRHGDLRPFARAELGYEWWHTSDDPFYAVDLGAEYSVSECLSLSGSAGWSEFLSQDWNGGAFSASLRANCWFTETLAASLTGSAYEGGTWGYGAAVVVRF